MTSGLLLVSPENANAHALFQPSGDQARQIAEFRGVAWAGVLNATVASCSCTRSKRSPSGPMGPGLKALDLDRANRKADIGGFRLV